MIYPAPVYETYYDKDIKNFYREIHSSLEDWDGGYSVTVAKDKDLALACNLYDDVGDMFLHLSSWDLDETRMPGFLYREIISNQHSGKTLEDLHDRCRPGDECGTKEFMQSVMQEHYPDLQVYHCDRETGVAKLIA